MLGLITTNKHNKIVKLETEKQIAITKYWQSKYSEAIQTQETLNAMLKEATSYEKDVKCSNCNNTISMFSPTNDNTKTK